MPLRGQRMDVRYFQDPETGEPHIYEHGISESEVEYVLRHAGEDRPGSDDSRHALGQTAAGALLARDLCARSRIG
jgi:hypothetical protein